MRSDSNCEETFLLVARPKNQLQHTFLLSLDFDLFTWEFSLGYWSTEGVKTNYLTYLPPNFSKEIVWVLLPHLLLLNFGLRVIINRLLGVRQIFLSILNIRPFIHHTGTAGQNQFLAAMTASQHHHQDQN